MTETLVQAAGIIEVALGVAALVAHQLRPSLRLRVTGSWLVASGAAVLVLTPLLN